MMIRGRPVKQLIGFERISLKAEEKSYVEFVVSPCEHLAHVEEDGRKVIEEGSYFLEVGKKLLVCLFVRLNLKSLKLNLNRDIFLLKVVNDVK
ncbi:putative beta-D-xylosidase 7 [Apostasia shenzhenica]|uniref:Putative beta-D-xylosidase 7 n=1 Tax=Apostasia shenzhenica TaxID=1088818 RepID=A0A2I0AY88_9ASPA|nr:putative beta-D-xylosidase 7 [Apostasia shenzhenica]